MKKTRKFDSKVIVATLCLAAAGWLPAQSQTPNTGAGQSQQSQQYQQQPGTTTTTSSQPMKINKCSQLIGSTVENPQGDKLGKIEEVVVDFDNGRVAYCVLNVEHKIFATTKYLAVPLAAMQPSADGSHLILNADKEKVAQAQGFDRNNWPSVTNPAWGAEPFWQPPVKDTTTSPSGTSR